MNTLYAIRQDVGSNIFLTGSLLMAGFDFASLLDYSAKAFIGGFIWMFFKLGADYLQNKARKNNE
jgi:hypothetical protein